MYNEQKMLTLLEYIEESNRKQLSYARLQFIFSLVSVLCCLLMLVAGMILFPKLEATVSNIDKLVTTSQNAVEQAVLKMNSIDIATLNKAIKDLAEVIEPLVTFIKKLPFV